MKNCNENDLNDIINNPKILVSPIFHYLKEIEDENKNSLCIKNPNEKENESKNESF